MAATIRFWIGERLRLGINTLTDKKIFDASVAADSCNPFRWPPNEDLAIEASAADVPRSNSAEL